MSDRVLYVTGNTQDRDHANIPTILRAQIPDLTPFNPPPGDWDKIWPVDVSLAQMMACVWKVRKWKLTGSVSATLHYTIAVTPFTILDASGTGTLRENNLYALKDGVKIDREQDLLWRVFEMPFLGSQFTFLGNDQVSTEDASPLEDDWNTEISESSFGGSPTVTDFSGAVTAGLSAGLLGGQYPLLFDPTPKTFALPFFGIGSLIPDIFAGNRLLVSVRFDRHPATVLSGTGPLLLKAPGTMTIIPGVAPTFTIPMQVEWRIDGEDIGSSVSGTASAAFTLEAIEHWPFA